MWGRLPDRALFDPKCAYSVFSDHVLSIRRPCRPYPQYGWDSPREISEKFRKDPGKVLRVFPGLPLDNTVGNPQAL